MSLFIEGKEVTNENIGDNVTYIPPHANGDINHKSCQRGVISSFNDTFVFVRFAGPNGQACQPEYLVWG